MDGDVFRRDREAEAGASSRARSSGVRTIEAIENVVGDLLSHSHTAITHTAGHVRLGGRHGDRHRRAVRVLDRVDNEVADHAFNAALIDLCTSSHRSHDLNRDALALREIGARFDDACHDGAQVAFLCIQQRARGVVSRDFQQVGEHLLHAFSLVMQELRRAACVRGQLVTVIPHDVLGHADRRQRRAQLVGHVGDEALLELRELVVARDGVLQ